MALISAPAVLAGRAFAEEKAAREKLKEMVIGKDKEITSPED